MTSEQGLLAAILAHPDDDALRLIHADWLEDHSQGARAELIRVQIELERLPEHDPRREDLIDRENELLENHAEEFLESLDRWLPNVDCTAVFQRGYVEEVTFWGRSGAQRLLICAEELFQRVPLRAVRLIPVGGLTSGPLPWEPRLKSVEDRLGMPELQALCELPELTRLTTLDLSGTVIDQPQGAPAIIVNNHIGNAGARQLAQCSYLGGLHVLFLRDNVIADEGALALLASPHLRQLQLLDLRHNRLSENARTTLRDQLGERVLL